MLDDLFSVMRARAAVMSTMAELFACLLWFAGHRAPSVHLERAHAVAELTDDI